MSGLTGARALTVLKLLAGGRDLDDAALMAGEAPDAVSTLAEQHGWPELERLRTAIQSFEEPPLVQARPAFRRSLELSPRVGAAVGRQLAPIGRKAVQTEFTGTKACARCGEVKPFTGFWTDRKNADGLYGTCKDCERDSDATRPVSLDRRIYQRAYKRAQARLRDAHPDEFEALLRNEIEVSTGETQPAEAGDPHRPVELLQPGPARAGQAKSERIRTDAGPCRICTQLHVDGHECPDCGWKPEPRIENAS